MTYLQIDDDKFIEYDESANTSTVISKSALQTQINNFPAMPPDNILLAWAKKNYPGLDLLPEMQKQKDDLRAKLDQLDNNAIDVSAQVKPIIK